MNSHKRMPEPLKIIWNRRWLILITTTAVMAATLWWANGLPKIYEASVVLGYTKDTAGPSQERLLANARENVNNRQTLEALIQIDAFKEQRTAGIGVDRLAENISQNTTITTEPRANGFAIRLRYRDRTPERAQSIAGALGQVIERSGFKVEQPSTLATEPIMPRRLRMTGMGIGAGILLGLVLAGIAEAASRLRNGKMESTTRPATTS